MDGVDLLLAEVNLFSGLLRAYRTSPAAIYVRSKVQGSGQRAEQDVWRSIFRLSSPVIPHLPHPLLKKHLASQNKTPDESSLRRFQPG